MTTRIIPNGTFRVRKDTRKGWPHDSFDSALAEAEKLAMQTPGASFIVMQDVARVTTPRRGPLEHWGHQMADQVQAHPVYLSPEQQEAFRRRLFEDLRRD